MNCSDIPAPHIGNCQQLIRKTWRWNYYITIHKPYRPFFGFEHQFPKTFLNTIKL